MCNSPFIVTTTCIRILSQVGPNLPKTLLIFSRSFSMFLLSFENVSHPSDRDSLTALPMEVLAGDWWVPGSTSRADSAKYQGKQIFREVLKPTMDTCRTWIQRATEDKSYRHVSYRQRNTDLQMRGH